MLHLNNIYSALSAVKLVTIGFLTLLTFPRTAFVYNNNNDNL